MRQHAHPFNTPNRGTAATGNLFDPPIDKICKLLRLLSSPNDAETLGAARALLRVLAESGTDIHHLADVVADGWRDPVEPKAADIKQKFDWQIFAEELLEFENDPAIVWGSRERDFLANMARSKFAPTALQEKWMNDINNRRPWRQQRTASA